MNIDFFKRNMHDLQNSVIFPLKYKSKRYNYVFWGFGGYFVAFFFS